VRFDEQPSVAEASLGRAFLEAVREEYPSPGQLRAEQLMVGINMPGGPEASTTHRRGWRAISADQAWTLSLLPDSVALETTSFDSFGDMEARLSRVLQVTNDLVSPALVERIGLRFVNLLPQAGSGPSDPLAWANMLSPSLRGPALDSTLSTGLVILESRALFDSDGDLKANVRWAFGATDRLVLDLDVFSEASELFEVLALQDKARRCNDLAVQLFYASLAPQSVQALSAPRA
jgi:uncharacterized protein (TIGR04255 family)